MSGWDVSNANFQDGPFFGECSHCGVPVSPTRTLKRCSGCQLVSYCSKDCQQDDWRTHKRVCKEFPIVNGKNAYHTTGSWGEHLVGLRDRAVQLPEAVSKSARRIFVYPKVCNTCHESQPDRLKMCKCTLFSYCSKTCARADQKHKRSCDTLHCKVSKSSALECMYPASFWNFLEQILKSGWNGFNLLDLGIIDIHVVTSTAYFDACAWEMLFHKLPNLEMLELTFIIQDVPYDASLRRFRFQLPQLGCKECDSRDRVIQYSVYQKPYHMYFSSSQYMEPDFVVTYGIPHTKEDVHNEISYRNMTYHSGSVLVLMDSTKDLLIQAVEDVKAAQPASVVLLSPERNPSRGFGANLYGTEYNAEAPNVKHYMAGLYKPRDKNKEIDESLHF